MPSFLLFFESSGENKKEFEVSSEDSLGEVIYKVFGKQAKRVALVAELAKVDGAMDALETLLGDKFDAEVENNAALSDLLLNLSAAKEGAIVSLTKLGPFGEDQEVIAKLKGEISKLNEFIIAKNKELKDKNDLILQIKQELNDKNIMIDAYQATQAGKERDKAEKLTQELAAANLAINELKEELKKSAPILSENAALREDLRLILTFIGEKDKSKVDTKDLQTDLGRQLADIVLPMLQEISELKQLRSITITGLEGQADLIKKAVEHIKNSLMAEIHSIEGTNAAKNNSIEDLNEQNAKLFEELQGYRARFDAYNALTAGIMDFGELLKKAKSRRLTKIEIRERAAGLEKVLEKLQASSGGEVEALIPELLNKMVYKLIELIQKEEMMKEMATLTVKLKMLCEEHKIDFSKVRVVSAQTGVEEGLDEALKALDTEGDFI
jgi:predicted  nucleic acid-binding Zn-ribbon protein